MLVALMGEFVDGAIILVVLLFNAVIGAVQEGRAENTLRALKHFSETFAAVIRDEREVIIPDKVAERTATPKDSAAGQKWDAGPACLAESENGGRFPSYSGKEDWRGRARSVRVDS